MENTYNLRSYVAKVISCVLDHGESLSIVLPTMQNAINNRDRSLLQELCFGTLRMLPVLEYCVQQLITKPMLGKHRVLHYLLLVGLYQILYTRIPPYAILSETVNGAIALKYPQFKGLINAVLRQFQRKKNRLMYHVANHNMRYLHPLWLLQRIQQAYPLEWAQIINANNQKPPMWLRVNRLYHTRIAYLKLMARVNILAEPHVEYIDAIRLITPCTMYALPGFSDGWVTVQDASSQGCMGLLAPKNGEHILDLCAAPGGKTTHILEIAPKAQVMAIDIDQKRLIHITKNLQRLHLRATVKLGDARVPQQWCDNKQFDRILLDAPCSAIGVIRRHPDIKWLRRDNDIARLANLQADILVAVWPCLKPGGVMLYTTCSILPEENREQIATFLQQHRDARLVETGNLEKPGRQILPQIEGGDGFFYAKLIKI
ncbi:16S rRNA (cytosine(967)-C(5))-methyltransferase RsmB [Candidatus Gillettellia adelgis]